jgi:lysophospholipase L1-like esterase
MGKRNNSLRIILLSFGVATLIVSGSLVALYLGQQKGPAPSIRVACIGDSITQITTYPTNLQILLGSRYTVQNFGVVGATVLLNTDRPYLEQTEFQDASAFKPNIVIVLLGTNDARSNIYASSENFESDYKQLISAFQNFSSKPQILLAIPPPIFDNTLDLISANLVQGIIPHIQQIARDQDLPTINLYHPLIDHPEYFPDGVHPNNDGSKIIAEEIFKTIISLNNS